MSETRELRVILPAELARLVETKVASGEYANESEVVTSALEALAFDDDASPHSEDEIERLLREEVVPTYEALKRDPSRALSLEEAKRRIDAYIAQRGGANADA